MQSHRVSFLCAILYLYCSASVVLLYRRLQPQYDLCQGQPQEPGLEGIGVKTNFHVSQISQHLRHICANKFKNMLIFLNNVTKKSGYFSFGKLKTFEDSKKIWLLVKYFNFKG
jgi:hypothetical protein